MKALLFFISYKEKYIVTELPICRNMEPVRFVVIKEGYYNNIILKIEML